MAEDITIKIKKQELTDLVSEEKENDKNIKYDVQVESDVDAKFKKLDKGEKSENEIPIKYRKSGTKEWSGPVNAKIEYDGGIFRHSFKLPKGTELGSTSAKLEEASNTFDTDKHSFTIWSYGLLVVLLLVIIVIVWWLMSSKKEDKEEEVL